MRRTTLLSILAVAGLLLDGCGTALSSSQVRATATRICTIAGGRADEIPTPATPAGSAVFIRRGIDVFSPELRDLQTLQGTGASSAAYATAFGSIAAELRSMQSALKTLEAGDDPLTTIKWLQRRLAPAQSRGKLAWHTLGIPACQSR